MENVEIIEQQEEPEPIVILDPEQEELGEWNKRKKLPFSHVYDNFDNFIGYLLQINIIGTLCRLESWTCWKNRESWAVDAAEKVNCIKVCLFVPFLHFLSWFDNLLCECFPPRLYLRWNMIKKIENLDTLITLEELELYDNQITKIENLNHLINLQWVYLL